MAHFIQNSLCFEGDQKEIRRLLSTIQSDDPKTYPIDFHRIIPVPRELVIETGSQTQKGLDAFREFVKSTGGDEKREKDYLPCHPEIDKEEWELGKQAFQNIQRYGHPTWFEWCAEHWNTSANALDGSVEENQLTFLSAEKSPEPIIQKISQMFPSVTIHYAWAGASLEDDCGARTYQNGAVIQENIHAGQEAVELA